MSHPDANPLEEAIAAAIGALRHRSFASALWELFRSLAQPDNLIVLAYRDAGRPVVLAQQEGHPRVFQRLEKTYLAGAYRLDPFFALHQRRAGDGAYRLRDIAPDAFRRSRYFVDYFGGTTLVDEIAFVVTLSEGLSLSLCLGMQPRAGRSARRRSRPASGWPRSCLRWPVRNGKDLKAERGRWKTRLRC